MSTVYMYMYWFVANTCICCSEVNNIFSYHVHMYMCIPFCTCRWKWIFSIRIFSAIAPVWNTIFYSILLILIVLFIGEFVDVDVHVHVQCRSGPSGVELLYLDVMVI